MAEPSPGDWRVRYTASGIFTGFIETGDGDFVASVAMEPWDREQQETNAHCMAASKQMLEALEMVAKYDRGNWMDRPWSRAVAKAIAKAKGQE